MHGSIKQPDIALCTDAGHINAIVNHPEVLPWVKGAADGPLDLSFLVDNPNVVPLFGEHGGVIFTKLQPGLYEAHSQYLPEGRGKWALRAARKALHWMFARTDAVEIVTRCPDGNLGAKALARAVGGKKEMTVARGWIFDGKTVPADIFRLTIQDWTIEADGLIEKGEWFHDVLEKKLAEIGASELAHDDDPCHDRYVGLACEMIMHGQIGKGVYHYNRFALMAFYEPVFVVSENPVVLDMGKILLALHGDDFAVCLKQ